MQYKRQLYLLPALIPANTDIYVTVYSNDSRRLFSFTLFTTIHCFVYRMHELASFTAVLLLALAFRTSLFYFALLIYEHPEEYACFR